MLRYPFRHSRRHSCRLRRLGRTDLSIAPLVLGGNVFGWTADKKTSFDVLDRFAAAGLNAIDTADVYSAWVPGNKGGESETIIGEWMKARGNRRPRRSSSPRSARRWARARKASSAALYRGGGRGVAQAAADRRDRPLSLALAGHGDADRGDARRLSAPDRTGQDPLVRRLEPHASRCSRRRSRRPRPRGCRATRFCSRNTISPTARIRKRPRRPLPARGDRRHHLFQPRQGVPVGQVPQRGRPLEEPARRRRSRPISIRADFASSTRSKRSAARHKAKPAEVALAWVMARPGVTAPIASATSVEQVESLVRATELTLTAADMEALNAASAP